MGTEGENFEIRITTPYDGTGAKQAQADLERTKAEAESAIGGKLARDPGQVAAAAQMNAEASKATAISDAEAAQAEARKTLEIEKQLVIATRQSMLEAAIAGDQTELAKLRTELSVRQLTVQTLSQEQMSQEQINALLADQNTLIEAGNAAVAERAAAEAAAAEAESGTVYGPRNRYARLARNFGFDANSVASAGIGLMIGLQLKQLIDHMSEEMDKQTSLRNKESEQLHDQVKSLNDQIRAARSVEDLIKARAQAESEIGRLQQERIGKTGEEAREIDARIHMLATEIGFTRQLSDGAKDRKTEEELVTAALKKELEACNSMADAAKQSLADSADELNFQNQIAEARLKAAQQQIKFDEDSEKISHEEAATRLAKLTETEDERKFRTSQEQLQKTADAYHAVAEAAARAKAAAETAVDSLTTKQAAAQTALVDAQAAHQKKLELERDAEAATEAARVDRENAAASVGLGDSAGAAQDIMSARSKEADSEKLSKQAAQISVKPADIGALKAAIATITAELAAARSELKRGSEESDSKADEALAKVNEATKEMERSKFLRSIEKPTTIQAHEKAVERARQADADRANKNRPHLTPEEEADLARRQAPFGRQADADVVEARSMAGMARGTAEAQAVLDATKKVHEHPTDEALVGTLVAALQKMVTHVNGLNAKQKANIMTIERRLDQVINQLKDERNGH